MDYIKERHNKRFNELKEKYELLQNNNNSLEIQVNTLSEKYKINSREMTHLKMNSQKEIDGLKDKLNKYEKDATKYKNENVLDNIE